MLCTPIIKRSEKKHNNEHHHYLRSPHQALQVHGLQVRGAGIRGSLRKRLRSLHRILSNGT